jgi:hypothetical protein
VCDERADRLVPGELEAVQVVCLAFVPTGGLDEVDDRVRSALGRGAP